MLYIPTLLTYEQQNVLKVGQTIQVTFEFLQATNIKMAVFWVVAQCSAVKVYRSFRGVCCDRPKHIDGKHF
jgi:hypothetical protein